ncbi:AAA domain-containing protein [Undibacterium sp.]|uniref:AAA domain-containing protein n=1 Tax=Undibacterium sp. TaxID=1914977 RepID=UPI0025EA0DA9|nr:AAA domain-containing protein [Undibacterium sp.]
MPASYLNTLKYWFDVEALMYPELPKPERRPHYTLRYLDQFPWQVPSNSMTVDDHKYFVYFGLVQKKVLETELFALFQTNPEIGSDEIHVRTTAGKTFLCAIEVTASGKPVASTLQLAAFAIAFAERKHQKRIGLRTVLEALQEKLKNIESDSKTGIADTAWFQQVTDFLVCDLDWQPKELMAREQIHVHRVELTSSNGKAIKNPPEMPPINSFYIEDLERIRNNAEHGPGSKQVQAYLEGEIKPGKRTDVTHPDVVTTLLDAGSFPVGRWPSKFPLFLMQQVAVNTAIATLTDGGIFSVNGPPGTGKTTLLMDVIAARIVERAKVLCEFEKPEHAFTKTPLTINYPANKLGKSFDGPCFFIDERLLDFGIVVASANNKAVENITHDLPNLEKVFPQPLLLNDEQFDYFAETAEALLNGSIKGGNNQIADVIQNVDSTIGANDSDNDEDLDAIKCWGLISVALGNKTNRNRVASQLGTFSDTGIQAMLKKIDPSRLDWSASRRQFNTAIKRVEDIQKKIQQFDKILPTLAVTKKKFEIYREDVKVAEVQYEKTQAELELISVQSKLNETQLSGSLAERNQYALDWPWWRLFIARVFNAAQYARTSTQRQELEDEYTSLRASRSELKRSQANVMVEVTKLLSQLRVAQAAVVSCSKELNRLEVELTALKKELGAAAFDPAEFAALSPETQQKTLIRSNDIYHQARAEAFVAAMALHQAFMKNAGKAFETNLKLALAMLGQEGFIQIHLPKMARHLWATFFLTVPVVSSTFASISRCFRDLGEGEIGLLLVDEAGQAVPSHALGAIWRSKRALIVGDPLQVEPVITMDTKLDFEILKYHKAPESHLLTRYSAQHLADRGNHFGANVIQYDGSDLWVGSPLRVHRRCVDPMFSIANAIAYNNKMVFGPNREDEITETIHRPLLGPSKWIDIVADDFEEHFSVAEGNVVLDMVMEYSLRGLCGRKDGLPELYIISPFKSVATGVTALLNKHTEKWARNVDEEVVKKWLQSHVGTVHTFQGKECESVIFILGGKSPGARSWAATSPNIINVAITRAKRRLYVVGNKSSWAKTTFGAALGDAMLVSTLS